MISQAKFDEIRRLLANKRLSHRTIAKRMGVSRGTVWAIASGRRPKFLEGEGEETETIAIRPLVRCPGCGGRVHLPCVLCRVRCMRKRKRLSA